MNIPKIFRFVRLRYSYDGEDFHRFFGPRFIGNIWIKCLEFYHLYYVGPLDNHNKLFFQGRILLAFQFFALLMLIYGVLVFGGMR